MTDPTGGLARGGEESLAVGTGRAPGQIVPVRVRPAQDRVVPAAEGAIEWTLDGAWRTARACVRVSPAGRSAALYDMPAGPAASAALVEVLPPEANG